LIAIDLVLDSRTAARHRRCMSSWSDFEAAAPDLAREVRRRIERS
jgi:hypothetical protein